MARERLFDVMISKGYEFRAFLKVPWIIVGNYKFYFKTQAIYCAENKGSFKESMSTWCDHKQVAVLSDNEIESFFLKGGVL